MNKSLEEKTMTWSFSYKEKWLDLWSWKPFYYYQDGSGCAILFSPIIMDETWNTKINVFKFYLSSLIDKLN